MWHACINKPLQTCMLSDDVLIIVQVLSESVSKALILTGPPPVRGTVEFVDIFDKFFDILNVSNFTNGKKEKEELSRSLLLWT